MFAIFFHCALRPSFLIFLALLCLPCLFYIATFIYSPLNYSRYLQISPSENDQKFSDQLRLDQQGLPELEMHLHPLLKRVEKVPGNGTKLMDSEPTKELTKQLELVQFLNANPRIYNDDVFGRPAKDNVEYVIIVQVHDRIKYLRHLIDSLSSAKSIEQILLVFSGDFNTEEMRTLIENIQFCRVMHLIYPFNIKLIKNGFPAPDCAAMEGQNKTDENCTENHSHKRKLAQIKHHWWWKFNFVFEKIMAKYGLDDKLAIFLEEDHVVTPDFLHTLQLMEENRTSICPECEILALGTYPKSFGNYEQQIAKLNIEVWFSSKNNIGMVMDRKLWRKVQNCSQFFCSYNDYNWDWTMLQLSLKCLPKPLQVIYPVAPRVIHIGDCGVHWTKCDGIDPALDLAVKLFERAKDSFFPSELEVAHVGKQLEREPSAPNGGWGDSRDRILCELNTHPADANATEVIEEARRAKG